MKLNKLLFILIIFITSNQVHSNPKGFNVVAADDHKPLALVIGNASLSILRLFCDKLVLRLF